MTVVDERKSNGLMPTLLVLPGDSRFFLFSPSKVLKSTGVFKIWTKSEKKSEFYFIPLLHYLTACCMLVPCIAHTVCMTLITILKVVLFFC